MVSMIGAPRPAPPRPAPPPPNPPPPPNSPVLILCITFTSTRSTACCETSSRGTSRRSIPMRSVFLDIGLTARAYQTIGPFSRPAGYWSRQRPLIALEWNHGQRLGKQVGRGADRYGRGRSHTCTTKSVESGNTRSNPQEGNHPSLPYQSGAGIGCRTESALPGCSQESPGGSGCTTLHFRSRLAKQPGVFCPPRMRPAGLRHPDYRHWNACHAVPTFGQARAASVVLAGKSPFNACEPLVTLCA